MAESEIPREILTKETDARFWSQTGYKPGQKLDPKNPTDKAWAGVWMDTFHKVQREAATGSLVTTFDHPEVAQHLSDAEVAHKAAAAHLDIAAAAPDVATAQENIVAATTATQIATQKTREAAANQPPTVSPRLVQDAAKEAAKSPPSPEAPAAEHIAHAQTVTPPPRVPPREVLYTETNLRFWIRTQYKPRQRLDMSDAQDKRMAKVWMDIFHQVQDEANRGTLVLTNPELVPPRAAFPRSAPLPEMGPPTRPAPPPGMAPPTHPMPPGMGPPTRPAPPPGMGPPTRPAPSPGMGPPMHPAPPPGMGPPMPPGMGPPTRPAPPPGMGPPMHPGMGPPTHPAPGMGPPMRPAPPPAMAPPPSGMPGMPSGPSPSGVPSPDMAPDPSRSTGEEAPGPEVPAEKSSIGKYIALGIAVAAGGGLLYYMTMNKPSCKPPPRARSRPRAPRAFAAAPPERVAGARAAPVREDPPLSLELDE